MDWIHLFRTLRYETRIVGWLLLGLPLIVVVTSAALFWYMGFKNINHMFITQALTASLEALLPLVVGVLTATLAVHDPALELQLTFPYTYRATVFGRLLLILAWIGLVELASVLLLHTLFPWTLHKPLLLSQLTWLAPVLWMTGVSMLLSLLLRSRTSSSALLGGIWIIQLAFHSYFSSKAWGQPWFLFATMFSSDQAYWLSNRIMLIGTAFVLLGISWWYLHDPERRFYGEDK